MSGVVGREFSVGEVAGLRQRGVEAGVAPDVVGGNSGGHVLGAQSRVFEEGAWGWVAGCVGVAEVCLGCAGIGDRSGGC